MTPLILGLLALAVGGTVALWRGTDSAEGEGTFGNQVSGAFNNFLGLDKDGNQQFDTALKANLQGAQDQRDWQEKMYYIDRDYTSPANQMRLYREAGLNPSLMYGQPIQTGQIGSGAEASSPSPSSGQLGALSSLLGLGQDTMMVPAQVDLMRAQAEEIRSRIPVNQQKVANMKKQLEQMDVGIQEMFADIRLKYAYVALSDAQRDNISFEQMLKRGYFELDSKKVASELQVNEATIRQANAAADELLARANLSKRELYEAIHTFAIRKAGLEKQNKLTDAQISQAYATAEKLRKEGVRIDQLVSIDNPRELNSQSWADDMSGKNGKINQGGAMITYQFMDALDRFGSLLR